MDIQTVLVASSTVFALLLLQLAVLVLRNGARAHLLPAARAAASCAVARRVQPAAVMPVSIRDS